MNKKNNIYSIFGLTFFATLAVLGGCDDKKEPACREFRMDGTFLHIRPNAECREITVTVSSFEGGGTLTYYDEETGLEGTTTIPGTGALWNVPEPIAAYDLFFSFPADATVLYSEAP